LVILIGHDCNHPMRNDFSDRIASQSRAQKESNLLSIRDISRKIMKAFALSKMLFHRGEKVKNWIQARDALFRVSPSRCIWPAVNKLSYPSSPSATHVHIIYAKLSNPEMTSYTILHRQANKRMLCEKRQNG